MFIVQDHEVFVVIVQKIGVYRRRAFRFLHGKVCMCDVICGERQFCFVAQDD